MDLRVLVVEDSLTARQMIRAILQTRHWTICGEAENGLAGISQFQSLKPDVVILDFTMPGINGIETARRMSKLDPAVPLILFTLFDVEVLSKAALAAGFYATVSKTHAWDLVGAIESAISRDNTPSGLDR
jgi:two-component system chemotaxis response regulator CheY